ncbi:MAG: SDR family oxidoreductase [Pseudomonadota bacterium]|nr:UDP-glucose 4-epimerase [Gammaproteobacteria bacterium]MEE2684474.1 SDR family oxidoreductase [Pseudomonadota bacterium]|tara:strand:+ start:2166 stop:3101 length:936 start_codon:yes stop_codon:yes gene_type:complete
MNVLITGGFGYLGQRLGRYLHNSGLSIYLASRSTKDKPNWLKNGEVLKVDWNNTSSLFHGLPIIDILVHTAGTNALFSSHYPDLAKDFNGEVTAKLLQDSIVNNVSEFMYLSTAHVYASPLEGIISENTEPSNHHPYATSHLLGERYVLEANSSGKIKGSILRLSNCFGPPVDKSADCWDLLVNDICLQAIKFNRINLRTSGKQSRDFIPISELCRMVEYLIRHDSGKLDKPIFNIGGKSMSVIEMANLVAHVFYSKYHKKIDIFSKNDLNHISNNKFEYKMNWLEGKDFLRDYNPEKEIEDLLDFCKLNF